MVVVAAETAAVVACERVPQRREGKFTQAAKKKKAHSDAREKNSKSTKKTLAANQSWLAAVVRARKPKHLEKICL